MKVGLQVGAASRLCDVLQLKGCACAGVDVLTSGMLTGGCDEGFGGGGMKGSVIDP